MLDSLTTARGRGCDGALLVGDWDRVLMVHFARDLWRGEACVSFAAFKMRGMRLRCCGRATLCLLAPIATHEFLNVRTYVQHGGQAQGYRTP